MKLSLTAPWKDIITSVPWLCHKNIYKHPSDTYHSVLKWLVCMSGIQSRLSSCREGMCLGPQGTEHEVWHVPGALPPLVTVVNLRPIKVFSLRLWTPGGCAAPCLSSRSSDSLTRRVTLPLGKTVVKTMNCNQLHCAWSSNCHTDQYVGTKCHSPTQNSVHILTLNQKDLTELLFKLLHFRKKG